MVKLFELWRDRFRVDISYKFSGSHEIGNQIPIRNLGTRPLILAHWELLTATSQWPFARRREVHCADYDAGDVKLESHATYRLNFVEEDHFEWGSGHFFWLRLHVAGRRPELIRVYP